MTKRYDNNFNLIRSKFVNYICCYHKGSDKNHLKYLIITTKKSESVNISKSQMFC